MLACSAAVCCFQHFSLRLFPWTQDACTSSTGLLLSTGPCVPRGRVPGDASPTSSTVWQLSVWGCLAFHWGFLARQAPLEGRPWGGKARLRLQFLLQSCSTQEIEQHRGYHTVAPARAIGLCRPTTALAKCSPPVACCGHCSCTHRTCSCRYSLVFCLGKLKKCFTEQAVLLQVLFC